MNEFSKLIYAKWRLYSNDESKAALLEAKSNLFEFASRNNVPLRLAFPNQFGLDGVAIRNPPSQNCYFPSRVWSSWRQHVGFNLTAIWSPGMPPEDTVLFDRSLGKRTAETENRKCGNSSPHERFVVSTLLEFSSARHAEKRAKGSVPV